MSKYENIYNKLESEFSRKHMIVILETFASIIDNAEFFDHIMNKLKLNHGDLMMLRDEVKEFLQKE